MSDKILPIAAAIAVGAASVPALDQLHTMLGNKPYYAGGFGLAVGGAVAALSPEDMPWLTAIGFGLAAVSAASLYSDYHVQSLLKKAEVKTGTQAAGLGSIVGALPGSFVFSSADMAARDPRIVAARGPAWSRR